MNALQIFKQLPKPHLTLLAISGGMLILFLGAHLALVRPMAKNVELLQNNVADKQSNLRQTGWPLDVNQLQAVATEKEQEERRMSQMKDRVVGKTTTLFNDKIIHTYETWKHFEEQISRLDYQQEFLRVQRKFTNSGIRLHENILNLSEDSTGHNTYELVLQLWAFEAALDKVMAYNLRPVMVPALPQEPPENGEPRPYRGPRASGVTVLPPTPYYLHKSDTTPYLLEFGVRLKLRGKVEDMHDFLRNAGSAPAFLAVPRMELRKVLPDNSQDVEDLIEAEIICAAYYLLDENTRPAPGDKKPKILPPGA